MDADDPHAVLRALRDLVDDTGPALAFGAGAGGVAAPAVDVPAAQVPAGRVPADEVAEGTGIVVTTSGSTGIPKSVVLSRSALAASAAGTAARIGAGAWVLALPLGYIAGLQVALRSLRAGFDPVLLLGPLTPDSVVSAAARLRPGAPRYTSLVPAQLTPLMDAAADDSALADALRSFEAILIGGQALPPAVRERALDAGLRIVRTYGSTETCGGCVYDGVPLDGVRIRVAAPAAAPGPAPALGLATAPGPATAPAPGEVQLAGPLLADGYVGDAVLTETVFVRGDGGTRWYRTGDAGSVTEGLLRIDGRLDNVIVSGGVNVSLDRVESVVRQLAGLESAVVVGVDDDRWGEASVVVVAEGAAHRAPRIDEIRDAVALRLGPYARPSRVVFVPEIPVLSSGKPDREGIRRRLAGVD
jgi:O-succinylbenzoic acid--CoA ligase